MKDLFNLAGKVALVTGGSRGIGEMIATGFVMHGVRTYISSRTAEVCDATAARLSEHGECISVPTDLSSMGRALSGGRNGQAGGAARYPGQQRRRRMGRGH